MDLLQMLPSPALVAALVFLSPIAAHAAETDMAGFKTFCTVGKEVRPLSIEKEAELFRHDGKGCLTHMWFGGSFKEYDKTRIRIYVDGEVQPGIDMKLMMGHGIGFADLSDLGRRAPRQHRRGQRPIQHLSHPLWQEHPGDGATGPRRGQKSAVLVDYPRHGKPVRRTWRRAAARQCPLAAAQGRKLHTKPLDEFAMCDVKGDGALYQVTIAGKGAQKPRPDEKDRWKDLSFMEACIRAYIGGAREPMLLSSGLEDYFLGTYYFKDGRYYTPVAGLTHFDKKENEFSAYRFHEDDPVFFKNGLRLTCRCGEVLNGKLLHDPPETDYTTYAWPMSGEPKKPMPNSNS